MGTWVKHASHIKVYFVMGMDEYALHVPALLSVSFME